MKSMYELLTASKAFMIPMSKFKTKMTFTGKERDEIPGELDFDASATMDMIQKNDCVESCQFVYLEAELDPILPQIDKADERSILNQSRALFWFKAVRKNGILLNKPGDYVVRPCPPFCSNNWL